MGKAKQVQAAKRKHKHTHNKQIGQEVLVEAPNIVENRVVSDMISLLQRQMNQKEHRTRDEMEQTYKSNKRAKTSPQEVAIVQQKEVASSKGDKTHIDKRTYIPEILTPPTVYKANRSKPNSDRSSSSL
eukprot:10097358-Heterocapsa_arctica.AAC.1